MNITPQEVEDYFLKKEKSEREKYDEEYNYKESMEEILNKIKDAVEDYEETKEWD